MNFAYIIPYFFGLIFLGFGYLGLGILIGTTFGLFINILYNQSITQVRTQRKRSWINPKFEASDFIEEKEDVE